MSEKSGREGEEQGTRRPWKKDPEHHGTPPFRWLRLPIGKAAAFRLDAGAAATSRAPEKALRKTMFLEQVSWLPDRPRPAPSRKRDRPLGTDLSPPVDLAGRVPGHSGGGRAGISPASLFT